MPGDTGFGGDRNSQRRKFAQGHKSGEPPAYLGESSAEIRARMEGVGVSAVPRSDATSRKAFEEKGKAEMRTIVGWSVVIGLLWFLAYVALQALAAAFPEQRGTIDPAIAELHSIGFGLGDFIRPIFQLALVLIILVEAARRLGVFSDTTGIATGIRSFSQTASVQAIIAIIIVVAVSISALGGLGDTTVLKDLALVVVGFYFGSRRSQNEAEAIAAGVAAGTTSTPRQVAPEGDERRE
jgi:hypothetical protein